MSLLPYLMQASLRVLCLAFFVSCFVVSTTRAQMSPPEPASAIEEEDPDLAYLELHKPGKKRLWLTLTEEAAFLGIGAAWYFLDRGRNIVDWDNPSWRERFTKDVLRFDNNSFPINFVWHPLSGAAFHAVARANGSSLFGAMALSALTSGAWEYLVEFREKVSVNDLIVTPVAGIALGEFSTQLGRYLHRSARHPSRTQKALAWLLGPMEALHRVRGPSTDLGRPPDNLGYSADTWHRFVLLSGYGMGVEAVQHGSVRAAELRADAELIAMPSHLHAGTFRRFFHDGDVTRLRLRSGLSPQQQDIDLFVQSTLFGFYQQRMPRPGAGHTWLVGMNMAYRYRRMWFQTLQDDVGLALTGMSLRSWTRARGCLLDVAFDLGPGMSGIHSFRYADWKAQHPDEVGKSILNKQGYAYGFGGWGQLSLGIESEFVRLTTRLFAGHYNSKEGLDRTQDKLTNDAATRERLLDLEGTLELLPFPDSAFVIAISLLSQLRTSEIDALMGRARLTRAFVMTGMSF